LNKPTTIEIDGETFRLIPLDEYLEDTCDDDDETPMVKNPFVDGEFVQVVEPKRPGHRDGEYGRVIGDVPEWKWDDVTIPMVYVNFPRYDQTCGEAMGQTVYGHGCRMPVAGLVARS